MMLVALNASIDTNNMDHSISSSAGFQCHFSTYEYALKFYTLLPIDLSLFLLRQL
jgi:hypothetical protein